jgi:tetratricopeptide (TPR) repeat protein
MKARRWFPLLCGFLLCSLLASAAAQSTSTSNPEFEMGVQAYKQASYEQAIQHFEKAVASEPTNVKARTYLATAYAQHYIPGADTPENNRRAEVAIEQYQKVLELDSSNLNAVQGIAYLNLQMKKFDVAKEYYRKASEIDPNDPESYYSIGVIDWTQTYQPRMELRAKLGLKPEQSLVAKAECWQVRDANKELVAAGIDALKKAIELRPDYDDAMAYMNLMYRERADIQCADPKANAADLKTADGWVDLTLATKKRKEQEEEKRILQPPDVPQ